MAEERRAAGTKKPDHPSANDADLSVVDRVLAGDPQAFEEVVRRHQQRVYRAALAVTSSPEDAEEGAQETFLNAYQHLEQFHREARFTTWLTRIAINEGLQVLRKRKPAESLDEPVMSEEGMMPRQIEDWHDNPEKLYAKLEIRHFVEQAVQSLPPAYRVTFVLRDVEGLSAEEAAEVLGLSVAALKSRLLRARLMMREALAPRFQRPPTFKSRIMRAGMMLSKTVGRLRHPAGQKEQT